QPETPTPLQRVVEAVTIPERKVDNTAVAQTPITQGVTNLQAAPDLSTFASTEEPAATKEEEPTKADKAKEIIEAKKSEAQFVNDLLTSRITAPRPLQEQEQQPVQPFGSFILDKARELGI